MLTLIDHNAIEPSTSSALEDLLMSLVKYSEEDKVVQELKKCGVSSVCQTHKMVQLAAAIAERSKKSTK